MGTDKDALDRPTLGIDWFRRLGVVHSMWMGPVQLDESKQFLIAQVSWNRGMKTGHYQTFDLGAAQYRIEL
jgi:hypothetical protein